MKKLLLLAALLGACDSPTDIDVSGLTPLPSTVFTNIHPAQATEYWELRLILRSCPGCAQNGFAMISPGPAVRSGIDASRLVPFDAARPNTFIGSFICLIGDRCETYVTALRSGDVMVYDTLDELRTFLGEIDTGEEAALMINAHGYNWSSHAAESGYRAVADGWEVVVFQTVGFCAPVVTDRVLFHVTRAGVMRELDREVFRSDKNACI